MLDNAFAFALDIASQIERANITFHPSSPSARVGRTEKLLSDVLIVAVRMIPHFVASYSVREPVEVNRVFDQPRPPPVLGDPGDLLSVFKNILENSVKYKNFNAPLKLRISITEEAEYVRVDIVDNGIGIDPGDEDRIFTRGYRTPRARRHQVRGGGLGLAYCREVLKRMGGTISATGRKDGLTITVKLRKA